MFILTGESGEYEDTTSISIAVSDKKEILEKFLVDLQETGKLIDNRNAIISDYLNRNHHRIDSVVQEDLLSKDHLPITLGKERAEINQKNRDIQRRNFLVKDSVRKVVLTEANKLAEEQVPMTQEQEDITKFLCDSYSIDEILFLK